MKLVVMQPTYLPWVGYFDLIDQSDVFVLYDSVQFERQSWQQRNRIKTPAGAQWLTVPVLRDFGQSIASVTINNNAPWRRKHLHGLVTYYSRAAHWASESPFFQAVYERTWERLADLNAHIIEGVAARLGLETKFVRSSQLDPLEGSKVEPLLQLCERFGADTYLSPAGAREYLADDAPFRERGVQLEFHEYAHPTWPQQHGDFIPFLSIVDLLLNTGPEAPAVLRSGRRP